MLIVLSYLKPIPNINVIYLLSAEGRAVDWKCRTWK